MDKYHRTNPPTRLKSEVLAENDRKKKASPTAEEMNFYSTNRINVEVAMKVLREVFPDGEADECNFALFSTSGVHGSYCTIEACETEDDVDTVTFLVIKPRIVQTSYGNCRPKTPEDFAFLKKLRATSRAVVREL